MINNTELIKQINKEDKYSLAYILDHIKYGYRVILLNGYKKTDLKIELMNLINETKYYNKLTELLPYNKYKL